MVYQNNRLEFIPTLEGRVLPPGLASTTVAIGSSQTVIASNQFYRYEYQLTDHLGTLRAACRCGERATATTPTAAYAPMVVQEVHYDPFGLDLPGLGSQPGAVDSRFKYNGKEEQTGLGWIDYGARMYDPAVPRWLQVDPLAEKARRWSPYAMSFDNPIRFIDPDGMWPYPINVRSFAPFKEFGGRFAGDNRGYSTSSSATSRLAQSFTVDPSAGSYSGLKTSSSPSYHPLLGTATANDDKGSISNFTAKANKDGSNTVTFTASMSGHNPLTDKMGIPTPDIDVKTNFTLTENVKAGTLNVNAVQTGDAFPSAETFIGDTKGNQLFIGVSPANGNPYESLPGDNDRPMMSTNFTVTMDSKGGFTGIKQGDKTYTLAEWNKMNQSKPTEKN